MKLKMSCFLLVAGLSAISASFATESDDLLGSLQPRGMVSDYAGVLSQDEESSLESTIRSYEQQTGNEIGVAVIDSLKGGDIDDFANKLFARWGVGKKAADNGVLLLVAITDRAARIEVGYGLEPTLTDAVAGRILREQMFPSFKEGRYGEGISLAVGRIISVATGTKQDMAVAESASARWNEIGEFPATVTIVVIASLIGLNLGIAVGGRNAGALFGPLSAMTAFATFFFWMIGGSQVQSHPMILKWPLVGLIGFVCIGYLLGRMFPGLAKWLAESGRGGRSSGGGWSSGGRSSGGSFGGGRSGGGGASGRW